ncbi:MAG: hypothetical protein LBJ57_02210 [Prevotellaceae bacterium]|nr:hypothetical protein [Prevotellaceae bacterium]
MHVGISGGKPMMLAAGYGTWRRKGPIFLTKQRISRAWAVKSAMRGC